jgi:2-methylisocitrate lyase-like PEP mutase family enzyme
LKVIAPTIFDQTTAAELEDAGAKIIIYTNQPAQAAIRGMTDMLQELRNQDHRIQAVPIFKRWKSISYEELQTAWTKLRQLFSSSIWYPVTSYCSTSWRIAHFAWPSYI